jgi:Ca2+-binding EF-hand superfamily protein
MKKLILLLAALALVAPAALFAAKADGSKAKAIAKYDTNKNGKIDGDEIAALRKDFDADPKGDLARFDTNHDGKLSDEEIAAIVPGSGKKSNKADKKSGGKKTQTTTAEK